MRPSLLALLALAASVSPALAQADVTVSGTVVLDGARLVVTGDLEVAAGATLDAASGGLAFSGSAASQRFYDRDGDGLPFDVQDFAIDKPSGEVLVSVRPRITGVLGLIGGTLHFEEGPATLAAVVESGEVVSLGAIDGTGAALGNDLVVYERPHLEREGWRMIASPLGGVPFTSLNDDFHTQGAPGADVEAGGAHLFEWAAGLRPGYRAVADYADVFEPGRGYFFYAFGSAPAGGLPTVWDVEGEENEAPTVSLAYNSLGADGAFNLLGNPFAAPLDWPAVQAAGGLQATYATWDPAATRSAGAYAYYSSAGVSTGRAGRFIAPFQGFWVETNESSAGTLAFRTSMKAVGESPVFVGRQRGVAQLRLRLEGQGLVATDPAALFLDGAASGADPYDARWLRPPSTDYAALYFVRDGDGLVFDARPTNVDGARLAVAVEVTRPGRYALSWPDLDAASEDLGPVTLVDRQTGTVVDLRREASYSFDVAPADLAPSGSLSAQGGVAGEPRFTLAIGASVADEDASAPLALALAPPVPNPARGPVHLSFTTPEPGPVALDVLDALGRSVLVLDLGPRPPGSDVVTLDASRLAAGPYLLRLRTSDGQAVRSLHVVR